MVVVLNERARAVIMVADVLSRVAAARGFASRRCVVWAFGSDGIN